MLSDMADKYQNIGVCPKEKNISFYLMIKKVQISKGDPSFVSLLQFGVIKEDMFLSIK